MKYDDVSVGDLEELSAAELHELFIEFKDKWGFCKLGTKSDGRTEYGFAYVENLRKSLEAECDRIYAELHKRLISLQVMEIEAREDREALDEDPYREAYLHIH